MSITIKDNTNEVLGDMDRAMMRALEAVGIEAQGDAVAICPVDTGRLRNSITHAIDIDGKAAIIGTNVEYALYVHEGTRGRSGQPFLTDAVKKNQLKYNRIFTAVFRGA